MDTTTLKYIGNVSLENIRDFILDNKLPEGSTIALHPETFDDLALDYRKVVKSGFNDPC